MNFEEVLDDRSDRCVNALVSCQRRSGEAENNTSRCVGSGKTIGERKQRPERGIGLTRSNTWHRRVANCQRHRGCRGVTSRNRSELPTKRA